MSRTILVLGAGMVGTCTALHLRMRGHAVVLVDRREPGRETSYGNAGIVQREAVAPYAFPRSIGKLLGVAFKRGVDVNYHLSALPGAARSLASYWRHSGPGRYPALAEAYARLIVHATAEHAPLMAAAGADDLVRRDGYLQFHRSAASLAVALQEARALARDHGLRHAELDADALATAEPALRSRVAGAVHWLDPWTVGDPGDLVARYAAHFQRLGGQWLQADAASLRQTTAGWAVRGPHGALEAEHAVVALGPWSDALLRPLGYRPTLILKRGYHRHYAAPVQPRLPIVDADHGFVLAPMRAGLRLTTGAEFALSAAPPTPVQLARAEPLAQALVDLGPPVEAQAWLGARPCTPRMLPVIGAAPRHRGLWFNFGHGHQGFTLGPVSGRLMADLIDGVPPLVDMAPYAPPPGMAG